MRELTKEYTLLFNTITDMEIALQQLQEALKFAQLQAESLYLERAELENTPSKSA